MFYIKIQISSFLKKLDDLATQGSHCQYGDCFMTIIAPSPAIDMIFSPILDGVFIGYVFDK